MVLRPCRPVPRTLTRWAVRRPNDRLLLPENLRDCLRKPGHGGEFSDSGRTLVRRGNRSATTTGNRGLGHSRSHGDRLRPILRNCPNHQQDNARNPKQRRPLATSYPRHNTPPVSRLHVRFLGPSLGLSLFCNNFPTALSFSVTILSR